MQELEEPTTVEQDNSPLLHVACMICWPDIKPGIIALCGTVLYGRVYESGDRCIVCMDLYDYACKDCGSTPQ
jgi:hypothetical protein